MDRAQILTLLTGFDKRLASIADQAAETLAHAQRTLGRLNRLHNNLDQLRARFLASVNTDARPSADNIQTPND
jgi:hypothetical protein